MKNIKGFGLLFVFLAFILTACGSGETVSQPQVTAPSIGVEITKDNCPSIEVQVGMQILWTNNDTVDRVLYIEHKDEQGAVMEAGGTDLLQPNTTFSIDGLAIGEYTYYCSKDRTSFGSILVTQ